MYSLFPWLQEVVHGAQYWLNSGVSLTRKLSSYLFKLSHFIPSAKQRTFIVVYRKT